MNDSHFDALVRSLSSAFSRRNMLRGFAGGSLTSLLGTSLGLVDARANNNQKKRRRKRRSRKKKKGQRRPPLVFNRFGCLDVNQPCRGNSSLCCSGICEGSAPARRRRDRSRCVAHNTAGCQAGQNYCTTAAVPCGTLGAGVCATTTGNGGFCFQLLSGDCTNCTKDSECAAVRGPGSACLVCPGGCPGTPGQETICGEPEA
jgi:hypothetical protein